MVVTRFQHYKTKQAGFSVVQSEYCVGGMCVCVYVCMCVCGASCICMPCVGFACVHVHVSLDTCLYCCPAPVLLYYLCLRLCMLSFVRCTSVQLDLTRPSEWCMHEGNLYSLTEGENTAKITSYNPCIKTMVTKPCNNITTTSSSMAVVVFIVSLCFQFNI